MDLFPNEQNFDLNKSRQTVQLPENYKQNLNVSSERCDEPLPVTSKFFLCFSAVFRSFGIICRTGPTKLYLHGIFK